MTYKDIEELQMLLDKDIRGVIAKGDIAPQDYQCLDVAIDISKDLCEIASMLPMMEENVSFNSYDSYEGNGNRGRGNSGNSYGMYGNHYPRMRSGARGGNNRGNSGDMAIEEKLNMMMQNASNEQERQTISKLMKEMENM